MSKTYIAFILTMPNRGSWNGRWSGEDSFYCVVKTFNPTSEAGNRIKGRSFYYRWEDGWGANVEAREIKPAEARGYRKRSEGFCGYNWMISSILEFDDIYADHEKPIKKKI